MEVGAVRLPGRRRRLPVVFAIEGLPVIGWAFLFGHLVDNRPQGAAWLGGDKRHGVEQTMAAVMTWVDVSQ